MQASNPFSQPTLQLELESSHLSKGPSDLKQNGTEEKTPFSVSFCHAVVMVWFLPIVNF